MSDGYLLRQMSEQLAALRAELDDLKRLDTPRGKLRARIVPSAGTNLATGTDTVVAFASAEFDRGGWYSAGNPNRLTVPVAGAILVTAQTSFGANATGYRQALLRVNGATTIAFVRVPTVTDAGANTLIGLSALVELIAGDYIELLARQTSGGAITTAVTNTVLSAIRIS